jgi:hypothetical protein
VERLQKSEISMELGKIAKIRRLSEDRNDESDQLL